MLNSLMNNKNLPDIGITILRVVVGIVFFAHGWQKLFMMGLDGVGGFFGSLGIPMASVAAFVVTFLELLGGAALIAGVGTRVVGALLAINMLVAFFVVHVSNGFFVGDGGYEFVLVLAAANIAFALMGAGPYSVDTKVLQNRFG